MSEIEGGGGGKIEGGRGAVSEVEGGGGGKIEGGREGSE